MSDHRREATLVRAAVGLDGPSAPNSEDWMTWFHLAQRQRVLPLLHAVADRGRAQLDAAELQSAVDAHLDVMAAAVRHEHTLLEITDVLDRAGVRSAVLKGLAVAHLDYPDPALRQFADVDLLVSPDDFAVALSTMAAEGWTQAYSLPRHHQRFTHAVTLRRPGRGEVDLHQRIGHRSIGLRVPTTDLLDASEPYEVAGRGLRALSAHDRLVHAAIHVTASRGDYRRLSSIADVLVLASSLGDEAGAVLARAEQWKVRPLVELAVRFAHDVGMLPLDVRWARAVATRTAHRDRLVELAYLGDHRRPVWEELAHLRLLDTWSDRATYLTGFLATDDDYAEHHHRRGLRSQTAYLLSRIRDRSI